MFSGSACLFCLRQTPRPSPCTRRRGRPSELHQDMLQEHPASAVPDGAAAPAAQNAQGGGKSPSRLSFHPCCTPDALPSGFQSQGHVNYDRWKGNRCSTAICKVTANTTQSWMIHANWHTCLQTKMAPITVKIQHYFLAFHDACCVDKLSKDTGNVHRGQLKTLGLPGFDLWLWFTGPRAMCTSVAYKMEMVTETPTLTCLTSGRARG